MKRMRVCVCMQGNLGANRANALRCCCYSLELRRICTRSIGFPFFFVRVVVGMKNVKPIKCLLVFSEGGAVPLASRKSPRRKGCSSPTFKFRTSEAIGGDILRIHSKY